MWMNCDEQEIENLLMLVKAEGLTYLVDPSDSMIYRTNGELWEVYSY
jgi:hypothetical protein